MDENVTRIPLRNKHGEVVAYALIDTADAELVAPFKRWHRGAGGYVIHGLYVPSTPETRRHMVGIRLHRLILGLDFGNPLQADHINGDRLDNRRSNLRAVTQTENCHNRRPNRGGSSRYRGVTWNSRLGKWNASAFYNGKRTHLGTFEDEDAAGATARAWRLANMPGAVD